MIRCNNCDRTFNSDSELTKILEIAEKDHEGNWHTIDRILYEGQPLIQTENYYQEVFDGCGECISDEYLMDI